MAIFLVDYENVYIEGLTGLEQLGEEDTLHIFYTQNRCGLTFDLYRKLTACRASVQLNEVSVSLKNSDPVKNALDIQLMMFAGYLIGKAQSDRICIVSKDKDFYLGTEFFQRFIHNETIALSIIPSIAAAFQAEETELLPEEEEDTTILHSGGYAQILEALQEAQPTTGFAALCEQYAKPDGLLLPVFPEGDLNAPMFTVQYHNTVRNLLGKGTDEETVSRVCEMIHDADTLVDLNNALSRYYRDGQRAKEIYHKFKPRFEDLRRLSRSRNKG